MDFFAKASQDHSCCDFFSKPQVWEIPNLKYNQ